MSAERLTRELADMTGRGHVRRVVLTEMAEVWSRRNSRARLLASARAIEATRVAAGAEPDGDRLLIGRREARVESDREHLASLRRILAAVKGA